MWLITCNDNKAVNLINFSGLVRSLRYRTKNKNLKYVVSISVAHILLFIVLFSFPSMVVQVVPSRTCYDASTLQK